ncbi:MAG: lipopolysaccharide heptosyltransferase II [Candidatus Omnitrophota bacterium]|nr:lipopolysaccharide heptosyltransferase II [Candidatus Omnitrophota bacterium]
MVNKILFITLSNIGDVILTLPVLDALRERFPQSKVTVMVGPRAKEIFAANPYIHKLIIYDKYMSLRKKIKLFFILKKEGFDLVVDLRNTLYGALLPARFRTSAFLQIPSNIRHMKERNLYRLCRALKMRPSTVYTTTNKSLFISQQDKDYTNHLLEKSNINSKDNIVIIAAVAKGAARRWKKENFVRLCEGLNGDYKVILTGTESDKPVTQYIRNNCLGEIFDFAGLTNLTQLAYLMQRSSLLVACDTGVLHLASYLDVSVLALFGASDDKKYGPWSKKNTAVVSRELFCRPCEEAQCRFGNVDCMRLIKAEDALKQARRILIPNTEHRTPNTEYKRILIVRTDRIGDALLSTPVIKALRDSYPNAYIAAMVSPYAKDIVDGNPYLDGVIIYDKDGKHKSWRRSLKFSQNLKKKRFDLALVLHPTNRVHLVTFFAGIRRRIGYDRKLGFLLTDRIKHTKHLGQKHELEYALDLVRYLGIEPQDNALLMPIKPESERWVEELFKEEGIEKADRLLAIHPGASCPSKIWPNKRFADVADRFIAKYSFKALVLAGPKDIKLAQNVITHMRHPAINLAGKTSVSQLASILKRCALFISNDSGPVHIAVAVATPVISIFGRAQAGLSPKRWGPLGTKDRILHKEAGCIECLAHNCVKEFACLKAITVDDVVKAAESMNLFTGTDKNIQLI